MPRAGQISDRARTLLPPQGLPWLTAAIGGGFVPGAAYLLAGEPGIGKTTLAIQILGDFARQGLKVLYVSTEQGLADLRSVLYRVHADQNGRLPEEIEQNFFLDDSVEDVDRLPHFLAHRVLPPEQEYHGTQVLVFDSVQGKGLAAAATKKYQALYQYMDNAKAHGLISLLIGHVTKRGQIAGPKDLEHNVDAVVYLRRAFRLRPLFVPKNRFGPAVVDPVVLVADSQGRLKQSELTAAKSAAIYGYAGIGEELAEAQASVSLPKYGSRSQLNAPFLPSKKIRQLLTVLSTLKEIDLSDLSYEINCYFPAKQGYQEVLDLPLAVALLSSYLQQPVPEGSLFVGELDLMRRIRNPEKRYLAVLATLLAEGGAARVRRIFLSEDAAEELAKMRPKDGGPLVGDLVRVTGTAELPALLRQLWPALFEGSRATAAGG